MKKSESNGTKVAVNPETVATKVLPATNEVMAANDVATEVNTTDANATGAAVVTLYEMLGLTEEEEDSQVVNGILPDASVANPVTVTPVVNPVTATTIPPVSNTHQHILAMKRAIHSKRLLMEFHASKIADWRLQSIHRKQSATASYHSRKAELEELLTKNELKFQKAMEKTRVSWDEYADLYQKNKVDKIADEISVLETELANLEAMSVVETPVVIAETPVVIAETPIVEIQPLAVA